jgi:hypothetical protein
MSSYWAEFAYAGSPGKGRNGKELAWNAWDNVSGKSDKFIIFDTKDDGGIRMSSDIITLADFKKKFLSETSFDDQKKYCETYVSLFRDTPLWDNKEFESLGDKGCKDYPSENY